MENQKDKCEHKEIERRQMIQQGYTVRGYVCVSCGEWIDYNPDFDLKVNE
jgi:hypothetical protein